MWSCWTAEWQSIRQHKPECHKWFKPVASSQHDGALCAWAMSVERDVRSECPILTFQLLFILHYFTERPFENRTLLCEVCMCCVKEICTVFDQRPQSFIESWTLWLKKSMQAEHIGQARGKKERKVCGERTMNQKEVAYTSILIFLIWSYASVSFLVHDFSGSC